MTEKDFEMQAQRAFAESVDALDAATLSRLNQGRQAALEESTRRPALLRYAPIGGLAAAAVIAVLMLQTPASLPVTPVDTAGDVEILLSDDSLEMFEDLEFFVWMELNESSQDDTSG